MSTAFRLHELGQILLFVPNQQHSSPCSIRSRVPNPLHRIAAVVKHPGHLGQTTLRSVRCVVRVNSMI